MAEAIAERHGVLGAEKLELLPMLGAQSSMGGVTFQPTHEAALYVFDGAVLLLGRPTVGVVEDEFVLLTLVYASPNPSMSTCENTADDWFERCTNTTTTEKNSRHQVSRRSTSHPRRVDWSLTDHILIEHARAGASLLTKSSFISPEKSSLFSISHLDRPRRGP